MDKTKLNELLDSIYELEGLVHLALTRDDNPDRLPSLIKLKGKKLSDLASGIEDCGNKDDSISTVAEESNPVSVETVPIEEDMQSVVETVFNELPDEDPIVEADLSLSEEPLEREPRGRLVFSINDRYRFKRELFGNSDVDFNNTLAIVASMENYDEAEDYFLGELQWDSKRQEVADFLDVIKRYFRE